MSTVRPASARDIPYLHHLDVCCFDNPWEQATWLKRLYDSEVSVAVLDDEIVGFSSGTEGEHLVVVDKIAVHAKERHLHLATKLLMPIVRLAIKRDKDLLMIIPETHLPDAGFWAKAEGFKPVANPILRNHFTICGEPVDGIAFTYELSSSNAD